MPSQIKETINKYDLTIILLSITLVIIGMVFVYSATKSLDNNLKYILVQVCALIIGIVSMYLITKIEYTDLSSFWPFIVGTSVFFLILVLFIGTGSVATGTKGWIRFGIVGIQPAEIVKIGFIITLARHLSSIKDDINYFKNVLLLLLHVAVPVFLVMLQPDAGTAMVFTFIFVCMVFVAGIHWRYILTALLSFGIFGGIAWKFLLSTYQKQRFFAFLNPESAPAGYGYHVMQSKIAIGSGQLSGKGLFKGIQTQLGILPEKHTDFIFAVIGEEAGFILCLATVAILFGLIMRCIYIGKNAKTDLGSYMCVGVAAMWLFHTFENIGMTIGLMPVTGIPLPFVSYGGSSILTNFMALGLILNVYMRRKMINF